MSTSIRPYQTLVAWKEAHKLCLHIYQLTILFPSEEKFGLVSQMRRSAYGISTNIAEGNGRSSKKERCHFLSIAKRSLEELHYQIILAHDLKYIEQHKLEECHDLIQRTGYLIYKLKLSLE